MKPWGRTAVAAGGVVVALAVSRPWTVRPIATEPADRFDATAFADSIWSRVAGEAATAVDLATALGDLDAERGPGARTPLFVEGSGTVTAVELGSRVGLLRLRVDGAPSAEVALQVGPVLRGTALRDALSFVRFTDFANQSEFAGVANALNDEVLHSVLDGLDAEALSGKRVSFVGAVVLGGPGKAALEIVPVSLEIAEEAS